MLVRRMATVTMAAPEASMAARFRRNLVFAGADQKTGGIGLAGDGELIVGGFPGRVEGSGDSSAFSRRRRRRRFPGGRPLARPVGVLAGFGDDFAIFRRRCVCPSAQGVGQAGDGERAETGGFAVEGDVQPAILSSPRGSRRVDEKAVVEPVGQQPQAFGDKAHRPGNDAVADARLRRRGQSGGQSRRRQRKASCGG